MCRPNTESPSIVFSRNTFSGHAFRRALRLHLLGLCLLGIGVFVVGCAQEMEDQRKLQPQEQSDFFTDHIATRPLPENVVQADTSAMIVRPAIQPIINPRSPLMEKSTGSRDGDQLRRTVPEEILRKFSLDEFLYRGREQFDISCAPCHDRTGSGNGMVPRRGFHYPPSYHTQRLRQQPLGYFFAVATRGRGKMPAYGDFISVEDRWAIAAYVRTLQLSQYVPLEQLSDREKAAFSESSNSNSQSPSAAP